MATILLTGNFKLMSFNSSRHSVHKLIRAIPFPLKKIWRPLDALSIGLPVQPYQLIHSYNRIPYVNKPWIISFETILPRTIGPGSYGLKKILRSRLLLNNCKKIIAISDYAKQRFIKFNKDWNELKDVINKLVIIHPNISLNTFTPKHYATGKILELAFIGNDFARKGGIVALRIASKAKKMGIPIKIHLISAMKYGANVYTDFPQSSRYENDLKLLGLDNVVFHKTKSNAEVIQLLTASHFQLMPTLDDTYGFSILEGFSVGTPAITTNVCALPEIVHHDQNGYLLHLDLTEDRNWIQLAHRENPDYWDILDNTYDELTNQALQLIVEILNQPERYEYLSSGAIAQVRNFHDSQVASQRLDNLYLEIINGAN